MSAMDGTARPADRRGAAMKFDIGDRVIADGKPGHIASIDGKKYVVVQHDDGKPPRRYPIHRVEAEQ